MRPGPGRALARRANGKLGDRGLLATATPQQLAELVEVIDASAAVLAPDGPAAPIRVLAFNRRFCAMAGAHGHAAEAASRLEDLLPPDALTAFRAATHRALSQQTAVEFEQAFDHDGRRHWWRLTVKPIVQRSTPSARLLVTGLDVSERIALEQALQRASSRFASVVDSAYDCIISIDQHERITLFNQAAQRTFGYTPEEALGLPVAALLPARNRPAHAGHVQRFGASATHSRQMFERTQVCGLRRDGTEFPAEVAISKISVSGVMEFTAVVRDVSERVKLVQELKRRASTDALTGLLNRGAFEERAAQLVREARQLDRPLTVVTLDVDDFKAINDTHGHDVGDEVLRALATTAAATIQHNDVLARLGGEEFAVLLPDAALHAGEQMAERVRRIFAERSFVYAWRHAPVPFTVSVGVSALRAHEDDLAAALKRADEAMYRAKRAGKNRVESAA